MLLCEVSHKRAVRIPNLPAVCRRPRPRFSRVYGTKSVRWLLKGAKDVLVSRSVTTRQRGPANSATAHSRGEQRISNQQENNKGGQKH
jgi:hypothetical protein